MAGFCIDEKSFTNVDNLSGVIDRLNERLSTIHNQHRQQVFKSSELDYVEIAAGVELWDLLYNSSLELISNDDRLLLIQTIDKCIVWDTDFELPAEEIKIDSKVSDSFSIMFVASKAARGVAIGLISTVPIQDAGVTLVSVGAESSKVFRVSLEDRLERFYRFQICFEKATRDEFGQWVHLLFPRLRFALEVSSQLRRFKQKYDDIREMIVDHLASLNDEFLDLLTNGFQLSDACERMRASCGVVISPESPNTHRNMSAMREREVKFNGTEIVCEFHTKLTPTHDRIHFSPTIRTERDGAKFIVVGPFVDHLTI
jgi:hypothetical protein